MSFVFKPAVWRSGVLYELPRPIVALRIQEAWDFEQFKVPLLDGDFVTGHSRQGVDVLIEGQVGTQAGALKASEAAMFQALEELRQALDVSGPEDAYDFFLYHDAASSTYRHLKSCTTVRFEADLSNKPLFGYSLVIHAEDPAIYATAPGEG